MDGYAIGLLEVVGRVASIEAADAGMKAANVQLLGTENATGALITVKFCGDVGAVKAAVEAAKARVIQIGATVIASLILPRPSLSIRPMLNFGVERHSPSSACVKNKPEQITEKLVIAEFDEVIRETGGDPTAEIIQEPILEVPSKNLEAPELVIVEQAVLKQGVETTKKNSGKRKITKAPED